MKPLLLAGQCRGCRAFTTVSSMQKQSTRPFSGSTKQRGPPQRAQNIVAAASDAVPLEKLLEVAERAAKAGAAVSRISSCHYEVWRATFIRSRNYVLQVIAEKVDKPRDIEFKGATDLVTDTDKASEEAVLSVSSFALCNQSAMQPPRACCTPRVAQASCVGSVLHAISSLLSTQSMGLTCESMQVLRAAFPDHALLGEEGGISGDTSSDYLWCIDPLDGTTNYAHKYPSFGVSVAVLEKAEAVAGVVVEFAGGPGTWVQRTYTGVHSLILAGQYGMHPACLQVHSAFREWLFVSKQCDCALSCTVLLPGAKGKGAFMNGQRIHVSQCKDVGLSLLVTQPLMTDLVLHQHLAQQHLQVRAGRDRCLQHCEGLLLFLQSAMAGQSNVILAQVTGFGYDHDEAWATNVELFKQFTDASRGVRRLGAAAVDLCHTALGESSGSAQLCSAFQIHSQKTSAD